jgi:hypothetical protein
LPAIERKSDVAAAGKNAGVDPFLADLRAAIRESDFCASKAWFSLVCVWAVAEPWPTR